ncbi:NAD(P)H-hydrate dehydratase [Pseudoglutamicibacter cumminsii]|uniref:ADP-dependent (S)-NAD(P)H-hydrate dehydratase n=1 Tax=Pseudoglutamicibacter cumminsii TaxID=156979 RepID=A0ABX5LBY7_9MICC|nr:NAD(P)H-hydrate dehydratase [Pseudoglutamicibacter cumminsii]PWI28392.1 NAD(P)H-hydrate dehydratase [Pseudoglutamicibacter cumminsii]
MHLLFSPDEIREAEAPMLAACEAAGDPDRLMRQAAHGLTVHIARTVTRRPALGEPTVPAPASLAVQVEPSASSGARALPRGGLLRGARIVGLIGPGNNGGDGLYALAGLAGRGARCVAVMVADRWHERAAAAAREAGVEIVLHDQALDQLATADVIVDAVLGIGAKGGMPIPGWDAAAQRWAVDGEPLDALVVAADCPSGLNTATGAADELVPAADMTVTFGALKRGLAVGAAREKTGDIYLVEIGLQPPRDIRMMPRLVTPAEADRELLAPHASDHKYSRGVLGVLAGSPEYPGAAVLCAKAAADIGAHDAGRGGIGMLVSAGRGAGGSAVVQALPEVVAIERGELTKTEWPAAARKVSAWVVGPGLGDDPEDIEPALAVMRDSRGPVVVDASALAVWEPAGLHVLTPHAGEFAALAKRLGVKTAAPNEDPLTAARDLASETGAVVLLKGSATVIAGPDGATFVAASAAPTLARAGSGDKLAGVVGAMLATHAARATSSGGELSPERLTPERIAQLTAAAAVLHGVKYSAV